MSEVTERNKEAKKRLTKLFGQSNVSVRGGRGTSYGWCDVELKVPKRHKCGVDTNEHCHYCPVCLEELNKVRIRAELAIGNISFGKYTDDMGYNHKEVIVQVRFL